MESINQETHDQILTDINESLKYLESLIHICNEDFPSQNYETRQKYEDQLCQLQNEKLELQEITHFDGIMNIETLMQDIEKNLDIKEQQMSDENRKEMQSQALTLQKICEDHVKELSKVRRMIIFLSKINSRILEMFKVYIQNTQTFTDLKTRRLNIDKLKKKIEKAEKIISQLQEIDDSLLIETSELQYSFEESVKELQIHAQNKTEQASSESSRDGENEPLVQFFEVSSTST